MVSIKENWTELTGTIGSLRPSDSRRGLVEMNLQVESAAPVPGFADFLSDRVGSTVTVKVKKETLEARNLVPGARVSMQVRRGRDVEDLFAHTQHIKIEDA
jgi:hypothetical protein